MKMNIKQTALVTVMLASVVPMLAAANVSHTSDEGITVSFADLDLTRQAGQDALYRRLEKAAETLCGPTNIRLAASISRVQANKACIEETMTRTLSQLDIPAVSAVQR